MSRSALSRRVFLSRAAGAVLTLGAAPLLGPRPVLAGPDPYAGGVWLSGDHHIHTHYSIDGIYGIGEQVRSAVRGGLDFCVITDHGGPEHQRVLLSQAYPQLLEARRQNPGMLVFQGLEWNIPAAEHGSVIMPPTPDEARLIAEFESRYDAMATRKQPVPARSEEAAIAGVRYLQEQVPKALFIANHPSRRGFDSPHELRAWSDAGPSVMRGIEGAPGHGASPLVAIQRGSYNDAPSAAAYPGYPLHAYRTWGGYDYAVAQVGGLWDALLSEGRAFYITANSDAHRYYGDLGEVTTHAEFHAQGIVQRTGRSLPANRNRQDQDYLPGTYARTYVHAGSRHPLAVLEGMRAGNMWTVLGGLLDGVELFVHDGRRAAPMGSTLLASPGSDIELVLRIRPARRPNLGGRVPVLHHIDLIAGDVRPGAAVTAPDSQLCPSARVLAQLPLAAGRPVGPGPWLEFRHRFARIEGSFFVRVRGTNRDLVSPALDRLESAQVRDPFADLWFYSNPVMVRLPPTPA